MNLKRAFTIAEVSVAIVMLGVLVSAAVPLIKKTRPNKNVLMIKKSYYALEKAVSMLINDDMLYPSMYGDGDCESTGDEEGYIGFECAQGNGSASYNADGVRKSGTHFDQNKFPCYLARYITGRSHLTITSDHKSSSGTACSLIGPSAMSTYGAYTLDYTNDNSTTQYVLSNMFRYNVTQGIVIYIEDKAFSDRMRPGKAAWSETNTVTRHRCVCYGVTMGNPNPGSDVECFWWADQHPAQCQSSSKFWHYVDDYTEQVTTNHAEITPISERMVRSSAVAVVVDINGPNHGPNSNVPAAGVSADDLDTFTVLVYADGRMEILEYWAIEAMKISKNTKRD